MSDPDETQRLLQALEQRISALTSAILRVNVSLGLATVLQEVVDSVCPLAGGRITAIQAQKARRQQV